MVEVFDPNASSILEVTDAAA
ncbi:iron-sulfur cluster assembly accessory protein, partial [Francisella tularensis subsp. holarctica]|nr:iron-sulfur cluster assembly accessory protein [Francisella tularensis subsp. holarctica]